MATFRITILYYYYYYYLLASVRISTTAIPDIVCPGDTITYTCTVLVSNNESVNLSWRITFPGLMPIDIIYDDISDLHNLNNLAMGVTTSLTSFSNHRIQSVIIILTYPSNQPIRVNRNGTKLTCSATDLINDTTIVNIDLSG